MADPVGTVTVHLSLDGETVETEPMALAKVKALIAAWAQFAKQRGLSRDDAKGAIITGLLRGQHAETDGSYMLVCAALWLAGDSVLRREEPCTLVHEITLLESGNYRFTTM